VEQVKDLNREEKEKPAEKGSISGKHGRIKNKGNLEGEKSLSGGESLMIEGKCRNEGGEVRGGAQGQIRRKFLLCQAQEEDQKKKKKERGMGQKKLGVNGKGKKKDD